MKSAEAKAKKERDFRKMREETLGCGGGQHVTVLPPIKMGKGIGIVLPNLLHSQIGALLIDPKSESVHPDEKGDADGKR